MFPLCKLMLEIALNFLAPKVTCSLTELGELHPLTSTFNDILVILFKFTSCTRHSKAGNHLFEKKTICPVTNFFARTIYMNLFEISKQNSWTHVVIPAAMLCYGKVFQQHLHPPSSGASSPELQQQSAMHQTDGFSPGLRVLQLECHLSRFVSNSCLDSLFCCNESGLVVIKLKCAFIFRPAP